MSFEKIQRAYPTLPPTAESDMPFLVCVLIARPDVQVLRIWARVLYQEN